MYLKYSLYFWIILKIHEYEIIIKDMKYQIK